MSLMIVLDENTPDALDYEVIHKGIRVTDRVVTLNTETKTLELEDGYFTTFHVETEFGEYICALENEFVAFLDNEGKPKTEIISGEAFDRDVVVFNKVYGANLVPEQEFDMSNAAEFLKYRGSYRLIIRDERHKQA